MSYKNLAPMLPHIDFSYLLPQLHLQQGHCRQTIMELGDLATVIQTKENAI